MIGKTARGTRAAAPFAASGLGLGGREVEAQMTLADFEKAVFARVQRLTGQKGHPAVYQPTGIKAGFPILNRKPWP